MGQSALGGIGVDDTLLHFIERMDCPLHVFGIAISDGAWIMEHQHCHRGHQHSASGHRYHRGSGCGNGVNLDGDRPLIIPEHRIDLRCCEHISAGAVDPDSNVAAARLQFLTECLGGCLIAPEGLLINRAFQTEHPAAGFIMNPVPEFLHRFRFLSLGFCGVLSLRPFSLSAAFSVPSDGFSGSSFGWFCSTAACFAWANFPASRSFTYPPFR